MLSIWKCPFSFRFGRSEDRCGVLFYSARGGRFISGLWDGSNSVSGHCGQRQALALLLALRAWRCSWLLDTFCVRMGVGDILQAPNSFSPLWQKQKLLKANSFCPGTCMFDLCLENSWRCWLGRGFWVLGVEDVLFPAQKPLRYLATSPAPAPISAWWFSHLVKLAAQRGFSSKNDFP